MASSESESNAGLPRPRGDCAEHGVSILIFTLLALFGPLVVAAPALGEIFSFPIDGLNTGFSNEDVFATEVHLDFPPGRYEIDFAVVLASVRGIRGSVICCYFENEPCQTSWVVPTFSFQLGGVPDCPNGWATRRDGYAPDGVFAEPLIYAASPSNPCHGRMELLVGTTVPFQISLVTDLILACSWDEPGWIVIDDLTLVFHGTHAVPIEALTWGAIKSLYESPARRISSSD